MFLYVINISKTRFTHKLIFLVHSPIWIKLTTRPIELLNCYLQDAQFHISYQQVSNIDDHII